MIKEKKVFEKSIRKIDRLSEITRKYLQIKALYLFGSMAEGVSNTLSDIDLAYLAFPEIKEIEELHYEICRFLKTEEVDLIDLRTASLSTKYNIIVQGKLLYCSDEKHLADFKEKIFMDYFDFMPYLKEYHKCFVENMRK